MIAAMVLAAVVNFGPAEGWKHPDIGYHRQASTYQGDSGTGADGPGGGDGSNGDASSGGNGGNGGCR